MTVLKDTYELDVNFRVLPLFFLIEVMIKRSEKRNTPRSFLIPSEPGMVTKSYLKKVRSDEESCIMVARKQKNELRLPYKLDCDGHLRQSHPQ